MKKILFLFTSFFIFTVFGSNEIKPITVLNDNYTGIVVWENINTGIIVGKLFENYDISNQAQYISEDPYFSSLCKAAVNENDRVAIIWQANDGNYDLIQVRLYDKDIGWSEVYTISDEIKNSTNPEIAISNNKIVAVWEEENGLIKSIKAKIFENDSWSAIIDLSDTDKNYTFPKVAINSSDNIIAVWQTIDNGNSVIQGKTNLSSVWSDVKTLSDTAFDSGNPTACISDDNSITVLWQKNDLTINHIYGKIYQESTGWSSKIEFSDNNYDSTNPQISTSYNRILITWESIVDNNSVIYSKIYNPKDLSWTNRGNVSDLAANATNHKSIISRYNYCLCIWEEIDGDEIAVKVCLYYPSPDYKNHWLKKLNLEPTRAISKNPSVCYNSNLYGMATWVSENGSNQIVEGCVTKNNQSWSSPNELSIQ